MKKFKKFISNEVLTYIFMFLSLFILAWDTNIFTRNTIDLDSYGFTGIRYNILWIGFSLSWIFFILFLLSLMKKKKRTIIYTVVNIGLNILLFAQISYFKQMGKFMIFSDLFVAGEGFQYIKSVFIDMNIGMIITILLSLICNGVVIYIYKKYPIDKAFKFNYKYMLVGLLLVLVPRTLSYVLLGNAVEDDSWKENYTAKNIYKNYTNPNTSMLISGFYEYDIRAIYVYFVDLIKEDKTALKNNVDEYNNIYGITHSNNEYTGILKDKNVIYIMMESMDSWIIDESTTPNLYKLEQEGMNFTNRYSPFFNGGQTINSEFALNTGLYAISNKDTIYDIEDITYDYSIANVLRKNGYTANSFHANTGKFYNRSNFHKLLGYQHHYGFKDMQESGLLDKDVNYFSDLNSINDDTIFDLMTPTNKKFLTWFTTYSAHLQYTSENKVYNSIEHNLDCSNYNEEECIYRTLAHDTDAMIGKLIEKLEKKGLLENTVIVLATDHYVYGYSDPEYVAEQKGVNNNRKELQNTPFIIWSKDIKHEEVDTILDTADILPTLLNMLGIEYDPNKYMGTDVFSDEHDDFVWFSDGTYIASKDTKMSKDAILTKTNYNIKKNRSIILTGYYGKE